MLINYVSALKAMSILHNLPFQVFEHPKVKYFLKAVKINCSLKVCQKHVIDISTFQCLISLVESSSNGITYKAMFLVSYFGFFRLSNLIPHAVSDFDPTRHFAAGDVIFTKHNVKMILKWSKTIQTRDQVKLITLPRLDSDICPFMALRCMLQVFTPADMDPLFQCSTSKGTQVPRWLIRIGFRLKIYSSMAPGRQTASGVTLR